jgi:tetratricopeptide (TPR) repeat protein
VAPGTEASNNPISIKTHDPLSFPSPFLLPASPPANRHNVVMPCPSIKSFILKLVEQATAKQGLFVGLALNFLSGLLQSYAMPLLLLICSILCFCVWWQLSKSKAMASLVDNRGRPLTNEPPTIVLPGDSPQPQSSTLASPPVPAPTSPRARNAFLIAAFVCLLLTIPTAVQSCFQGKSFAQQVIARFDRLDESHTDIHAQLDRIEKNLRTSQSLNPDKPPVLSAEDQAILDAAKASVDERLRLRASVLDPDNKTDELLANARSRQAAEAFELDMLEGKRWYFSRPVPQPDRAIPFFDRAVEARPADFEARTYAALAHKNARLGNITEHRQRAVELCEGTLALVSKGSVEWALTQSHLGQAYTLLPTGNRGENLSRAIQAYRAASEVFTSDSHPLDWSIVQNNLGATYTELPIGNRLENLNGAIAAYEAALEVRTRDKFPAEWAMTQNNLGAALLQLHYIDTSVDLGRAIALFRNALEIRKRDESPIDWAITQRNLGAAYLLLRTGPNGANVSQAIRAFEAALEIYDRTEHPFAWAATQMNLGIAYAKLRTGDRNANLIRGITAFDAAVEVLTRDAHPNEWAMTQHNLGMAHLYLSSSEGESSLHRAVAALEASLDVYTRNDFPAYWANTHQSLALAYVMLSSMSEDDRLALLRQAIASSKAALIVLTPEAFPNQYATTMQNLHIYRQIYKVAGGEANLSFDAIAPAD